MFRVCRSLSRTVHEEHREEEEEEEIYDKTNDADDEGEWKSLTVWRKSLVLSCSGFTVINSKGNLVYRVDNYRGHPNEIILMDGSGKSLLTIYHRKQSLRLVDNWIVFKGEGGGYNSTNPIKKPMFWARKQTNYISQQNTNVLAHVYCGTTSPNRRHSYVIEGSYTQRSCKIFDESRRLVAEIKKKEAMVGGSGRLDVSFGLEVFLLIVRPGFDPGFAMAIVLLLDQMFA